MQGKVVAQIVEYPATLGDGRTVWVQALVRPPEGVEFRGVYHDGRNVCRHVTETDLHSLMATAVRRSHGVSMN